jgi:tetratricopeptide (TPR) repeat protein
MEETVMVDKEKEEGGREPPPGEKDGEPDEISRYRQILVREPTSLIFAALAEAYRKRSLLREAIEVCRRGLRAHPNFLSGRVALARAYAEAGQMDPARKELEKVVSSAPDNLVAQRLLADIYREHHHLDLLEKTLHRILALDAGDEKARQGLAWIEQQRRGGQRTAEAEPAAGRRIVTRTLAEIYASQGYHDKAFEIYQELSSRQPENALYHARLADLKELLVQRGAKSRGREEHREAQPVRDAEDGPSGIDREGTGNG